MQSQRWCPMLIALTAMGCSTPEPGANEGQGGPRERSFDSVDIEGEPMFTVLSPDGIPSIDEPVFVSAEQADAFLEADEPVLGVVGADGTAKAYSAWQLDGHEIVNDWIDGEPIAATW